MTDLKENEFAIPIATEEVKDGPRFVEIMAQVVVRVNALFVDGEDVPLKKPVTLMPGQTMRFPITQKNPQQVGAYVEALKGGGPKDLSKVPMAGKACGAPRPTSLIIPPGGTMFASYNACVSSDPDGAPVLARFKRLALAVDGDASKLTLESLRIGTNNYLLSTVPVSMTLRPNAFGISDALSPGVLFSLEWKNESDRPITLTGDIVFERVTERIPAGNRPAPLGMPSTSDIESPPGWNGPPIMRVPPGIPAGFMPVPPGFPPTNLPFAPSPWGGRSR